MGPGHLLHEAAGSAPFITTGARVLTTMRARTDTSGTDSEPDMRVGDPFSIHGIHTGITGSRAWEEAAVDAPGVRPAILRCTAPVSCDYLSPGAGCGIVHDRPLTCRIVQETISGNER